MCYLVAVGCGEEREKRIAWLRENGYEGKIEKEYKYNVIFIRYNSFCGGNVTCFAAHTSRGDKVLSWEEWKELKEKNKYY